VIIEAQGLRRDYGSRRALDNVGFTLSPGHALAVFGPNGAGKTTLLRLLTLALRPRSGELRLFGLDARKDAARIRPRIGLLSHQTLLYDELTAVENLRFFGTIYGTRDLSTRIPQLLETVGLTLRAEDPVAGYSRGMLQRLSIARALIHRPDLLLLDEPFTGLDPAAAASMSRLLLDYVREGGSMVMVGHDLDKGKELCDQFLFLRRGRLDLQGQGDDAAYEELRRRLHAGSPA